MADYDPPIENLPIFDSLMFKTGDEPITQRQADKRYLRYPNAQGTENLQSVNISGTLNASGIANFTSDLNSLGRLNATGIANFFSDLNSSGTLGQTGIANFSSDVNSTGMLTQSGVANFTNDINSSDVLNIYDATLANQNKICLNLESQGVPLNRLRFSLNPTAGFLNPIVRSGDIAMCYGTTNPNATAISIAPVGATSCGLRMSREGIGIGSGGTGVEQNNRIIITPASFSLVANGTSQQVDISNNIVLNNGTGTNRQITASYLKLTDITSNTPTVQIYGSGTNIAMDNNIIMSNASSVNRQITSSYLNVTDISSNALTGQIYGSGININFSKNIKMIGAVDSDRQITTTFLNLTDIAANNNVCQIYGAGNGAIFDNNVLEGAFVFATDNALGVQSIPLRFTSGTFDITTTSSPTYTGPVPATSDNTTKIPTTQWVQSVVSPLLGGRTQTVSFTSSIFLTLPDGIIGIGVRMIGKGGAAGNNAVATSPTTSWYSGGTGGGAASVVSNGMVGMIGGTVLNIQIDNTGCYISTNAISMCSCGSGNNGGNATSSSPGTAALAQTTGSSNSKFGSFTLFNGSVGQVGLGPNTYQSVAGVPVISASSYNSSPIYQSFIDGVRGCGRRYSALPSNINFYQTGTPQVADGIVYLTYYYI